jgi:type II secretory pathway component GspD/PulD (secretin)
VVTQAQSLLATLDTAPPQVVISSEIVSINSSEVKNLGINWSGVTGTNNTPGQINVGLTEAQSNSPLSLGRIIRAPIDISATLNALETMDKAKVINRPSTVVQNGEQATIHVGSQFFYAVVSAVTQNGPVYSQQSLNTGVTLQVRPTVSQDGLITLEITTNVTDTPTFRRDISGLDLPIIPENSSTTVVQVRSGETLVIGGLMQSREEEHRQAVSGLGRLPLIGSLFRSKRTLPAQSELVILVTPSIVGATAPAAAPSAGR